MSYFKKLLTPAALSLYILRYDTIWRLREAMLCKCVKNGKIYTEKLLWKAYGQYFEKRCSFVGPLAKFAGEPCFPHGPLGVFVSNDATVGKDCVIFQNVTIGSNHLADAKRPGGPVIGDRVYIGAGAVIVGNITIGDGCRIGAGAVVYEDMPPNSVAVCAPTRIIQRDAPLDNRHLQHTPNGTVRCFENGKYRVIKKDATGSATR